MTEQFVDLFDLAATALASTISASIPIRNLAHDNERSNSNALPMVGNGTKQSIKHSSTTTTTSSSREGNTNVNDSLNSLESNDSSIPVVVDEVEQKETLNSIKQASREKNDGTLVTAADGASQQIIVDAFRSISKEIRIIGEESFEDERGYASHELIQNKQKYTLELDCTYEEIYEIAKKEIQLRRQEINNEQEYEKTECSQVIVFIDPLDGTKNFARGRYDAVTILVAIILDNTPVFGVICKPFGQEGQPSIHNSGCFACYGGSLLQGAYTAGGGPCNVAPMRTSSLPRAVISKSRAGGVVGKCLLALNNLGLLEHKPVLVDGAGEKSLRLLVGIENEVLWFFPKPGTSLWDVAALDAILISIGGKLTDKNGKPLDYTNRRTRLNASNNDGIVASTDATIHETCIRIFRESEWELEE